MEPTTIELIACVLFGLAILHTFSVKRFEHMAHKYPEGSIGENAYHFLGEVEVVFGLWAGIGTAMLTAAAIQLAMLARHDWAAAVARAEARLASDRSATGGRVTAEASLASDKGVRGAGGAARAYRDLERDAV